MKHTTNEHDAERACAVERQGTSRLTAEQIEHVRKFIEQAGGVENARRAIEALEKLRPAA